ncbi:hypothetical protein [Thioalkalivibrio sulfidiphilus]|uniref:hypothetical protein n=1 Tax=Thioalkalivibrio sulfidiphilus TaxID=1033854 RepID=UPI000371861E|nr:hypothetical protein [Thioalkalivibrio sulfidiphilus]
MARYLSDRTLVNGIRIRLRSGARFVIPDDPEDEEASFLALLGRALKGEIVEMEFSRYLGSLAKPKSLR